MIKDGDDPVGSEVKVKVVKNKVAPPFRTAEFSLMHDRGIDLEEDVLKIGVDEEIVTKSGAFFSYKDQRLGQGKDNAKTFLREHPELRDAIIAGVLAKHFAETAGLPPAPEEPEEEPEEIEAPAPRRRGKAAAE
jgi:recombination protein RecA